MSSSTAQRFGVKTYSRSKDTSASRAFDEVVSNKPTIKAASTHTKWGKTNFKAMRESQRLKVESQAKKPRLEEETKQPGDPFSFDADTERRKSPVKKQVVFSKGAAASTSSTRLPGTRIATRSSANSDASDDVDVIKEQEETDQYAEDEFNEEEGLTFKPSLAMSKRTYTRAPFANPTEAKKKLVTEVAETKPVVNFGFGDETPESSFNKSSDEEEDDEVSFNFNTPQKEQSKPSDTSDNEDDFVPTFKKLPMKTFSTAKQAPVPATSSSDNNSCTSPLPTAITRGPHSPRRASRYTDPKLLQEYKRMYVEKTSGKNQDEIEGLTNSTVISKAQVKGNKGTTLIVVCKPKGVEQETKETVQHKYFGNPSKALSKADRPITIDVLTDKEDEGANDSDASGVDEGKSSSYQFDNDSSDDSCPWPGQPVTYSSRSHAKVHSNNISTVQVRNKVFKSSYVEPSPSSSSEPVPTSSQDSNVSESAVTLSSKSSASSVKTVNTEDKKPVTYSAKRSYRIFKSRAPPEVKTEVKEEIQTESEPPRLELEPPTLEPVVSVHSPQASPPCLSEPEQPCSQLIKEEEEEEESVPMDTTLGSSQETDPRSCGSNKSSATFEDMDVESDSQSIMSEDSHESQEDSSQDFSSPQSQVPEKKKIFKSRNSKNPKKAADLRRKVLQSPKKSPTKAIYNARSWQRNLDPDENPPAVKKPVTVSKSKTSSTSSAFGFEDTKPTGSLPKLTRAVHWPKKDGDDAFTSLKVNKEAKQLFTVVRNVKQAFEVQESGETQDFMDDVEYLLDGLQDTEPISIRCLSCIQLAGKCTQPAFRMHLRAHGTMTKIFHLLHDAHTNPSLALGTATIMYMLSKDRLNMDLERDHLNLMLRLLEVDSDKSGEVQVTQAVQKEFERTKVKVKELCVEMQSVGTKLDLDTISTGNLAMESLLSLTSRKAGDWFKEELRTEGALDHIVETVAQCSQYVGPSISSNAKSLSVLKKLDRCLRVLENITYMNTDNQSYVISYKNALLISSVCSVLRCCEDTMPNYPVTEDPDKNKEVKESLGFTVISCVLAILRVLLNVTHENEFGSQKVGEQEGLMECVLLCVFSTTNYAPADQKFDILVLCIGLLINMVEHCLVNRRQLIDMEIPLPSGNIRAIESVVELFLEREKAARQMDEQRQQGEPESSAPQDANKSGEWQETEVGVQWIVASAEKLRQQNNEPETSKSKPDTPNNSQEEPSVLDDDETFTEALHKAGKHMENCIVASYIALLVGCLIQDNLMYVNRVKEYLPDGEFDSMIRVLKKFLGFMNLTSAIGNTGGQPIAQVIEILEAC